MLTTFKATGSGFFLCIVPLQHSDKHSGCVCAYTNKLCHLVADGIERGLEDIQGKASLQSSLTIIIPQLVYFFFCMDE